MDCQPNRAGVRCQRTARDGSRWRAQIATLLGAACERHRSHRLTLRANERGINLVTAQIHQHLALVYGLAQCLKRGGQLLERDHVGNHRCGF